MAPSIIGWLHMCEQPYEYEFTTNKFFIKYIYLQSNNLSSLIVAAK